VIVVADRQLRTLTDLSYRQRYRAQPGGHGGGNERRGRNGSNQTIRVPVGTVISEPDGEIVADLSVAGQSAVVAAGGRGGRGNAHFARPERQAPRLRERGEPGQGRWLHLELKLLADVGVVGMPNAGKSTLIARVSAARPKIADYPFTTLVPNLGVVRVSDDFSFVLADLPGLIEGAHDGVGLGDRFLRHVERTRVLVHLLDLAAEERDPVTDFDTLNRELAAYSAPLAERPQLVGANKLDLPLAQERFPACREALEARGYRVFAISAATGEGVSALMKATAETLSKLEREAPSAEAPAERIVATPRPRELEVARTEEGRFTVSGTDVERVLAMADLEIDESVARLQRDLESLGVIPRLRELGAKEGDQVTIGDVTLDFVE
jgi:GTP-binding protein